MLLTACSIVKSSSLAVASQQRDVYTRRRTVVKKASVKTLTFFILALHICNTKLPDVYFFVQSTRRMTSNVCFVVVVGYKITLYYIQGILFFAADCLQKKCQKILYAQKIFKVTTLKLGE